MVLNCMCNSSDSHNCSTFLAKDDRLLPHALLKNQCLNEIAVPGNSLTDHH